MSENSPNIQAQLAPQLSNEEHIEQIQNQVLSLDKKVEGLSSEVTNLDTKFDIWQNLVEPMLATTQTAMQYDNYILTATAIFVAIAGVLVTKWYSKSKNEAIEEAIDSIEATIARGILPERSDVRSKIVGAIISSKEFQDAVDEIFDYRNESKEADDSRAEDGESHNQQITSDNLKENSNSDD